MKRILTIVFINVFFLIAFLACQVISAGIIAPLHAGRAASAWAGESGVRFAQLAVIFPYTYSFDDEAIFNTRKSLDTALLAEGFEADGERRVYADAWSAEGTVSIIGEHGSSTAPVIGVGGDFFLFHPLYLRSGSYISPNDVMRDRVVLDEELAWRLYGSVNLAGLNVLINGKPFVIAGVAARESGFAYSYAYGIMYEGSAGLFMSYEALSALGSDNIRINNYEIVMPDIVTGFALSSLEKAIANDSAHIIDNTERFDYANLFDLIGSLGERSLRTDALSFPYWENALRLAEDRLALLLVLSLAFLLCPLVFGIIYAVRLIRYGLRKAKGAIRFVSIKRENRAYSKYMQRRSNRESAKQDTL